MKILCVTEKTKYPNEINYYKSQSKFLKSSDVSKLFLVMFLSHTHYIVKTDPRIIVIFYKCMYVQKIIFNLLYSEFSEIFDPAQIGM